MQSFPNISSFILCYLNKKKSHLLVLIWPLVISFYSPKIRSAGYDQAVDYKLVYEVT
jgi:hypothetical protein